MASEGPLDGRYVCEIGMSMAVERLLRSGYQVALPIIDDGWDLLAMDCGRCWRIQVKSTARSEGKNRSRVRIKRGSRNSQLYAPGTIDAFIVANTSTGLLMCVPYEHARGRSWINWSESERYSDFNSLRKLRPIHN